MKPLPSNATATLLVDMFDDEAIGGWAIPRDRIDGFLSSVEKLAREMGAVPLSDVDFLEFDNAISSFLAMRFREQSDEVLEAAERIIGTRRDR